MATVGSNVMTSDDIKKMVGPDGLMLEIVNTLFLENQILNDVVWQEGNLPTGNLTGIATSIPRPGIRVLNQGANRSKASRKQITDTCCILEDNSEVDEEVIALAPNKEAARNSEDGLHAEGFRQSAAEMMFYGNTDANDGEFNGLDVRYNKTSAVKTEPGYQVILGGGSASTNTSIWLVDWSANGVVGIYPKGSQAGLKTNDEGRLRVEDNAGNPFYAYCTNMKWKLGLAVKNYRKAARVANVDVATLTANTTLFQLMTAAKNRLVTPQNPVWYVNETIYTYMENKLNDTGNIYISQLAQLNKPPQLYFRGIPVRMCDAILSSESTIS
jgi:hypothetical protein